MIPIVGKKYVIRYLGEHGYDPFEGIAKFTGRLEVWNDDGVDSRLFEFEIDRLLNKKPATGPILTYVWFDEDSILAQSN